MCKELGISKCSAEALATFCTNAANAMECAGEVAEAVMECCGDDPIACAQQ